MTSMPENINLKNCSSAEESATKVYNYLQEYVEMLGYGKENVMLYKPEENKRKCWAVSISISSLNDWTGNVMDGKSISDKSFVPESTESEITGFHQNEKIDVQCKNQYTLEFYDL